MSWVERAKVGDKVVFLGVQEGLWAHRPYSEINPIAGSVYTIREMESDDFGRIGLRLVEIVNRINPYVNGTKELAFHSRHFRPVRDTTLQVEAIKRAALDVPAKSLETVA